ncbi:homeobox protein SIX3 [Bactrocera dorsalis]|uniref:Homeobox protein SIX3 n=1 Tax=Bactrocera dorsalis TaxID=27457 RepID=A0A6I9V6J6_BACDO|nr:homeobox protein SIX3 [Bactrocera dorsalis]
MRAFIFLCVLASAYADKLGYNYRPVGHSDSGLSFTPGGGAGGLGGIGSVGGLGGSLGGLGGSLGGLGGSGGVGPAAPAPVYQAPVAEYEKEFFTYTADENEFSEPAGNGQVIESLKKNLRVIFIKGPEGNGLEKAAVNLAKHAAEERTAIYVLQKQANLGDLANKLQAENDVQRHKPEVHFVKYRTPEDAANAQRAIQSQYDQLGGNSQSYNGGDAPVHNFASPTARPAPRPVSAPGAAYLPSSIFRV